MNPLKMVFIWKAGRTHLRAEETLSTLNLKMELKHHGSYKLADHLERDSNGERETIGKATFPVISEQGLSRAHF